MEITSIGIVGTSLKEDERRVPLHPQHYTQIPPELRRRLTFEEGYGEPFGVGDAELVDLMGGVVPRAELLATCDLVILCKPLAEDLRQMKQGAIHWGWAHCVQQFAITQAAIDRRLTLITWESMNLWDEDGRWHSHLFYRNNEIAGYAAVHHALALRGIDGRYGPPRRAAVINFGSVGRGAVTGLRALGFEEISLFVQQDPASLSGVPGGVQVRQMVDRGDGFVTVGGLPFIDALEQVDVLVNAILQDPNRPLTFLAPSDAAALKPGALIVDVSCDEGMGFPFARPTTFAEPIIPIGPVHYYAVDHTPSYLWNSASWEISRALLPYLPTVAAGPSAWMADETIHRAVEIRDGVVLNPDILAFQNREERYPHRPR